MDIHGSDYEAWLNNMFQGKCQKDPFPRVTEKVRQ